MRINEPRQDRCAWVMHLLGARRPWKSGSGTHIAQTPRFNQHSAVFDWDRPRSVDQPIRPKYERTPTSQSDDIRPRRLGTERHHLCPDLVPNEPDPVAAPRVPSDAPTALFNSERHAPRLRACELAPRLS